MPKKAHRLEYRLEVIDGYMRPVFEGKSKEWTELMWDLLLPFPPVAAALLADMEQTEASEADEWSFETSVTKVTCTPKTLVIEEILKEGEGREPLRIELPLREAVLLMTRWVFECVWREQYGGGHWASGQAQT
jgi:hypothetical protein